MERTITWIEARAEPPTDWDYKQESIAEMFRHPSSILHTDNPGLTWCEKLTFAIFVATVFLAFTLFILRMLMLIALKGYECGLAKRQNWRDENRAVVVIENLELEETQQTRR